MYRIDDPSAIAVRPAPDPLGTEGYFQRGTGGGAQGTVLTEDYMNMIQVEMEAIRALNPVDPGSDKTDDTQLADALVAYVSSKYGDQTDFLAATDSDMSIPFSLFGDNHEADSFISGGLQYGTLRLPGNFLIQWGSRDSPFPLTQAFNQPFNNVIKYWFGAFPWDGDFRVWKPASGTPHKQQIDLDSNATTATAFLWVAIGHGDPPV
jgi:hypothetical protein